MWPVWNGEVRAQAACHQVRFCSLLDLDHTELSFFAHNINTAHFVDVRYQLPPSRGPGSPWQVSMHSCFCRKCQQSYGLRLHVAQHTGWQLSLASRAAGA